MLHTYTELCSHCAAHWIGAKPWLDGQLDSYGLAAPGIPIAVLAMQPQLVPRHEFVTMQFCRELQAQGAGVITLSGWIAAAAIAAMVMVVVIGAYTCARRLLSPRRAYTVVASRDADD